jgi:hypothetical protein
VDAEAPSPSRGAVSFSSTSAVKQRLTNARCVCEVPGLILLQAYLYTYSLLRGVTFSVLSLSTYALRPTMLPLLETFLELLLWNSFQFRRHISYMSSASQNFRPFKVDFVWKQPEVIRRQVRVIGWVFISVIDFLVRNRLTESSLGAGALSWWRIQSLCQSSGNFLRTASRNCFHIST